MASMIRGYFKESKSCIIYLLLSQDHHIDRHVDDILWKNKKFRHDYKTEAYFDN
jgi:hypothetical protein